MGSRIPAILRTLFAIAASDAVDTAIANSVLSIAGMREPIDLA